MLASAAEKLLIRGDEILLVRAYLDGNEAGRYTIYFNIPRPLPYEIPVIEAIGVMQSYRSGQGIPRVLVDMTVSELQQLSTEKKKKIVHGEIFGGKRSKLVLPHLFEEHGYRMEPNGSQWTRAYRP